MANATFRPLPSQKFGNVQLLNHLRAGIGYPWIPTFEWRVRLDVRTNFLTESDGSQEVDLNTLFPNNAFPANVVRGMPYVRLVEVVAGGAISAATITVGDTGAANGLLTSTNVFTGAALGVKQTVAAAEFAPRFEAAFAPVIVVATTSANVTAATTGIIEVGIQFMPMSAEMIA